MKNDKNVKQVSRLTGALLARKGKASPSPESSSMNGSLEKAIMAAKELNFQQNVATPSEYNNNSNIKEKASKGKVSTKKSRPVKSSNEPAVHKRIAMTLRMEEENHLKLRLYSAHTRKSCQVILSEALDLYLAENNDKVPLLKIASQNI